MLVRQGVEPELRVVGAAAPLVPILGPVVHEEQHPGRRQALDQRVQQRLGLGVDPVEVLEDHEQRLHLALPQQESLHRSPGSAGGAGTDRAPPTRDRRRHVEERQERRQVALQRAVQGEKLPGQLLPNRPRAVPVLDPEVGLEQIDHRQVGRRLPVRDRARLEHEPAVDPVRVGDFPDQARLAHARLPHDRHDLPLAVAGAAQRLAQLVQLARAAHEAGQASRRRRVEPRSPRPGAGQLVDLDRRLETLHGHRPQRRHRDESFRQVEHVGRQERGVGLGQLLHASGQVGRLPDRGIVHPQIAPDRPDHHLAGVDADSNLEKDTVSPPDLLGVSANGGLHVERRVARADGVVLVGDRRAEERHDPVAHHLVHRALVAVDRGHHVLEHRVQELPRLLGIPVGQELHRALEVGEQHRDLLALALDGALGGEDLLGEVLGDVGLGRREPSLSGGGRPDRLPALQTELCAGREVSGALGAFQGEPGSALQTELCLGWVLVLAPRTRHHGASAAPRLACGEDVKHRASFCSAGGVHHSPFGAELLALGGHQATQHA